MSTPSEELADQPDPRPLAASRITHHGMVWDIARDTIDFAPGVQFDREYVRHTGAVAVLAIDDQDRALLIRQYRHPARSALWEIPAGLLDIDGEDPADAAARELREETGYTAEHLEPLLQLRPSPGGSDELIRIYRARDVTRAPDEEFEPRDEEAELLVRWVPVSDVAGAVLSGRLTSGTLVTAILAHLASRSR
ncbi:NUDIX domain-containing protein [Brachybacterium timonense]|uniref:NUDIX domain-containing protein n=1 Tax=Brachybacterium timonense TaxID=2050896 RepID=UPI000D0BE9B8|nr:NUDIX hydrolase [Brachybacterium timonense]